MTKAVVLEDLLGRRIDYSSTLDAKQIVLGLQTFGALVFERTDDLTPDLRRVYRQTNPTGAAIVGR